MTNRYFLMMQEPLPNKSNRPTNKLETSAHDSIVPIAKTDKNKIKINIFVSNLPIFIILRQKYIFHRNFKPSFILIHPPSKVHPTKIIAKIVVISFFLLVLQYQKRNPRHANDVGKFKTIFLFVPQYERL